MRSLVISLVAILSSAFMFRDDEVVYPVLPNSSFSKGETLIYHANYGIFTVGECSTVIDPAVYTINNRACYKIDAYGKTGGLVAWITKVRDQWGAYVDTAALVTHVSYRKLKEGDYRRDELVNFDHKERKAEVKVKDQKTGIYGNPKLYDVPNYVRDLVAGFMYLRVLKMSSLKKGDTISVAGFHEDKAYNLKIIFAGKETIKSKMGKVPCYKLVPIVPDNKLFDGENSVTTWISADKNQIPISIVAKMFIGSFTVELASFKGLRNQLVVSR
jgi:hypothetical protein